MRRPSVLIADDHAIVAEGLVKLLSERFEVIGTVADGAALVEMAKRLRPDVIVSDLQMPTLTGLEAFDRIKKSGVRSKFVFLTMHAEAGIAARAMRAGASGYLLKLSAGDELVAAVDAVLRGETYLTPAITKVVLDAMAAGDADTVRLTPRQREVLRLIVEGRRMKEIAATLQLSARTVETHKYEMMQILGVQTTAELIALAVSRGLVTTFPPPKSS